MIEAQRRIRGPQRSRVNRRCDYGMLFLCGLMAFGLLGCGRSSGPRRVAVVGSIISSNELVPAGTIRFLPAAGNNSSIAVASITDGVYRFTSVDGPFPGKYKVIVTLELTPAALAQLSQSSASVPQLTWEQEATVPDQDNATLHFDWPGHEE